MRLACFLAASLPALAAADTVVLYANDFESPNQPLVHNCGNSLDLTPINTLYGDASVTYEQQFTVEGVFLDDPGGLYSNPSGQGGLYAVGMLSTNQDDRLGLTFDAQGLPFINFALDLSAIDVSGCGGPFGSAAPVLRVSVLDAPGGAWTWTDTPLDSTELTGAAPPDAWTFEWTNVVAGLDVSGATDGTVTLVFDLLEAGYAVMDNLSITASTDEGVVDTDLDGVADDTDNCVEIANPDQEDTDEDGVGDACDPCPADGDPGDADGDGVCDSDDLCDGDDASGDADGDGWCAEAEGAPHDCDDADDAVNPGADEACNGVDDDCDGAVPADETDGDGDGVTPCDGDCDDANDAVAPGADEVCNGVDDDCDGVVPADETDGDGDGVAPCEGDCDDASASVHPAAEERCDDGIDDDCDGVVDPEEDCPAAVDGCACDCESSVAGSATPAGLLLLLVLGLRRRAA